MYKEEIDITDSQSVEKWCYQFGCSKDDLEYAVLRIGNSTRVVKLFLELNRRIQFSENNVQPLQWAN